MQGEAQNDFRRMRLQCTRATCDFLCGLSTTHRGKALRRSNENRAVSARKLYGARAASVWRPREDGTVTVRPSCRFGHSRTKSVKLHISPKTKGGKENGSKKKKILTHRKAAARSWCGQPQDITAYLIRVQCYG